MLLTHNGSSASRTQFPHSLNFGAIRKSKTLDRAEAPNGFLRTTLKSVQVRLFEKWDDFQPVSVKFTPFLPEYTPFLLVSLFAEGVNS